MTFDAALVLALGIAVVGIMLFAWRTKRPGESFDHATDRIMNNKAHKERESMRRAGLLEDTPKPTPPPEGDEVG